MLGNFSIGDYFKQGAAEFAWELSTEGFGFDPEEIWATVFEGDDELGIGPDEEAIDAWLKIGVPRERIVLLPRSENFWQAGPTGPCGPCSELYLDRGLEFGKPRRPPGRRQRALPGVLEPRVHAVRPGAASHAHAAAGPEHRHRPGPEPHGVDPAGHAVGVRDRPVPPADRARRGAERQALRRDVRDRPRAADPRRPHARHELPGRRRRRAVQRGPRLRAAAADAPRDRAGPPDRHRGRLPAAVRGPRARADGGAYPEIHEQRGHDPDVARPRGGGVQPHARAGHAAARRRDRARARTRGRRASAPTRRSCSTTPTASRSTSRSSWRPSRTSASTSRASRS